MFLYVPLYGKDDVANALAEVGEYVLLREDGGAVDDGREMIGVVREAAEVVEHVRIVPEVRSGDEAFGVEVALLRSPVDGDGIGVDGVDYFFGAVSGLDAVFIGEEVLVVFRHGVFRAYAGMGREV